MEQLTNKWHIPVIGMFFLLVLSCHQNKNERSKINFNENWKFHLGDTSGAELVAFSDEDWRVLDLPHDWGIEGEFSDKHPATPGGGALPGGIGWYRKSFSLSKGETQLHYIEFDGVYMNSEVWINGNYLGKRPSGYISFSYGLTPYLKYDTVNIIAVKVDNSQQPNSRWYSGSGIYRNVWLTSTNKLHVGQWGTYVTTPLVNNDSARINIKTEIINGYSEVKHAELITKIVDAAGVVKGEVSVGFKAGIKEKFTAEQQITIENPVLWSIETPYLYTAETYIVINGKREDKYESTFGIRYFDFDSEKGFSLNGYPVKIKGVCNHHDLGCLGAAINTRALERQLEILKEMGCNGIRTSHNPPAPELLDLCDKMGFIVMDEAFDMWKKNKSPYDYSLYWDEWHERDLTDFMKRDRNHPCIFMWSIGNEILEQWDSSGVKMVRDLYKLAKKLDDTRPITTANNPPNRGNYLNRPMVVDLIGYNYAHQKYGSFHDEFPGEKFIATETTSALATRGHYDMPSDVIKRWPVAWDKAFTEGNPDNTVSAYDHVSTPWGSTHEESWKVIKKHDYLSGMFVWTGFDYLGEPTPYWWPSRSSYFGIIDLAGFPKDSYYMYQSEWTGKPVLHIFPHWNWETGKEVDVWAYSNFDEVELFLNGKSLGVKSKQDDDLHVQWRVKFQEGELKAVARKAGQNDLIKIIRTAGDPAKVGLMADRTVINADGSDLSYITVKVLDKEGNMSPKASNFISFEISGPGKIVGVDNGDPTSHEPFKASYRKAFNGMCLLVLQSLKEEGEVKIKATSDNLKPAEIIIKVNYIP